jgi:hypothetical protein
MAFETRDGREPAPPVRGVARTNRVRAIAMGEDYQAIADDEGVSLDAIYQFASRNRMRFG